MSDTQINATALLCRLLEQPTPEINGAALLRGEFGPGGRELLHERMLVFGSTLGYVICPDCGIEMARVVRQTSPDNILVYCDECGEVDTGIELQQTYRASLNKLIERIVAGLELMPETRKVIDADMLWRLGIAEPRRGKAVTWYFGRQLNDPEVARRLLVQIRADQAQQSAKILTSSIVPLPLSSLLTGYSVLNLASVARLSQSRFLFYQERPDTPTPEEVLPTTSLRLVRDKGIAFVNGSKYVLEGMQKKILLSLIDAHAHQLESSVMGTICGSESFPFQPAKFFSRNNVVYKEFVKWVPGDKVYELIIHPEDSDWL